MSHGLTPIMADASVFTSQNHVDALVDSGERFYISSRLFQVLFHGTNEEKRAVLSKFGWADVLPSFPRQLEEILIPYEFKSDNVFLFFERIPENKRRSDLTAVLLDEYSFLKEHSSLLLRTRRTLRYLGDWGASVLDVSNRAFDTKHEVLQKLRGPRWLLAMLVSATGLAVFTANPILGGITFLGGVFIAVTDP